MAFVRLKTQSEDIGRLVPPRIAAELEGVRPYVYAVTGQYPPKKKEEGGKKKRARKKAEDAPEDTVLGAAVFSLPPDALGAALLHYVSVIPEYRGRGVGGMLLKKSFQALKKAGAGYVLYRQLALEAEELLPAFSFGKRNGFIPFTQDSRLLIYEDIGRVRESAFIRKVFEAKAALPAVTMLEDFGDPGLIAFQESRARGLLKLNEHTLSLRLSRFFVQSGRIQAAVCVKAGEAGSVTIHNLFLAEDCGEKNILPILLAHCLRACMMETEVSRISVELEEERFRNAVVKVIGAPGRQYRELGMVKYV